MTKQDGVRHGRRAAGGAVALALLLAGCGPRSGGPAPLVTGGQANLPPPAQITVERGQTLSGIAAANHVAMQTLADANHLTPPYRIIVGQVLIVPGGGAAGPYAPALAMGEPPPAAAAPPPAVAAPPPPPASAGPIPLDRPPPPAPLPTAPGPRSEMPPPAQTAVQPAVSPESAARRPETAAPPPPAAAAEASRDVAAPDRTAAAQTPPAAGHGGGVFLWPVRGRILEGYGAGPDGTHNDGINIAAPRGAAIEATDSGVVAYTGNELRGYGNLILIKHPNGFISAYAHCDLVLVKTGQKVARGQVIARVGSTGNVGEPQLHFELRRGKKPVDPSDYLAPLPSAAAKEPHPG